MNVSTFFNNAVDVLVPVITAVGVYVIKIVGDKLICYLAKKEEILETQKGSIEFDKYLNIARTVAKSVLQDIAESKDIKDLVSKKETLFKERMKKFIPGLTDEELNLLMQAVKQELGEGNTLLNADTIQQQVELVKTENTNLKLENEQLKQKLANLSTLLNPSTQQPIQGGNTNVQ